MKSIEYLKEARDFWRSMTDQERAEAATGHFCKHKIWAAAEAGFDPDLLASVVLAYTVTKGKV